MSTFEIYFNVSIHRAGCNIYSGYYYRLEAESCLKAYAAALQKLESEIDVADCHIYDFQCKELI